MTYFDKKNVIVGAARLYIGTSGTTKPTPVTGTSYSTTMDGAAGWRAVGYTTDGVEFATDPTYDDITVDQQMDAVRIFKSGMGASVSTTMAEATLENLVVAWGQAASTASALGANESEMTIEGGTLGDAPVERGLIAVGNAPEISAGGRFGQRIYHLFRVLSVEGSTINMSRTDPTTIPVTFRALPDDTTGRYGTIRDRFGSDGYAS
jgi:hypothetical protein